MITILYQNGEIERFRNCEGLPIQSISFSVAVPVLSFESRSPKCPHCRKPSNALHTCPHCHVPFSAPPSVSPSGAELSKEGDTTAPSHLATPAPGADNTGGGSFVVFDRMDGMFYGYDENSAKGGEWTTDVWIPPYFEPFTDIDKASATIVAMAAAGARTDSFEVRPWPLKT